MSLMFKNRDINGANARSAVNKQKKIITQLLSQSCWTVDDLCSVLELNYHEFKAVYLGTRCLSDEQLDKLVAYFGILFR